MAEKLSEKTQEFLEENYVDVCRGPMRIQETLGEMNNYFFSKEPTEMIVHMIRKADRGYITTIYLTKEDFEKRPRTHRLP